MHKKGQGHPIENFANVINESNIQDPFFLIKIAFHFFSQEIVEKDTLPISGEICSTSS